WNDRVRSGHRPRSGSRRPRGLRAPGDCGSPERHRRHPRPGTIATRRSWFGTHSVECHGKSAALAWLGLCLNGAAPVLHKQADQEQPQAVTACWAVAAREGLEQALAALGGEAPPVILDPEFHAGRRMAAPDVDAN